MLKRFGSPVTINHKKIYFNVGAEPWNIYALKDKEIQTKVKFVLQNVYQIPLKEGKYNMEISIQGNFFSTTHMNNEKRRFNLKDKFYHNDDLEEFKDGPPLSFVAVGIPTPNSYWLQDGMYMAITPAVRAIYKTTKYDDAGYPCFYVESDIRKYDKDYVTELSLIDTNN